MLSPTLIVSFFLLQVKMQTYPHLYRNAFHCFTKTFSSDGLRRGLYRGTVPSLAANIAENSVLFCAYGVCQSLVARASGELWDLHSMNLSQTKLH